MATKKAVAASLILLGRAFAGTISKERADAYATALEDLTDDELATATTYLMAHHAGEFIPVPAVIRKVVRGDEIPRLDVDRIVREVSAMGEYNPNCGWQPPSVRRVRQLAGNAIADAYADVGASRLYLGGERTREIAAQEFRKALTAATGAHLYASFPPWAVANPPRLATSEAKQLPAGSAAPLRLSTSPPAALPRDQLDD